MVSSASAADWSPQLGGSAFSRTGNVEYTSYNLFGSLTGEGDMTLGRTILRDSEFLASANFSKSTYGGFLYTNDAFVILKFDLQSHQRLSPFFLSDWAFDSTTGLANRTNVGVGAKVRGPYGFSISYAAMWSNERYVGGKARQIFRHSIRPKYKRVFEGSGMTVQWILFYTPALDPHDHLVSNEVSYTLGTRVKWLSVTLWQRSNFNSVPPAGYGKWDHQTSVGLVAQW